MNNLYKKYLKIYLTHKPIFLSLIRANELAYYEKYAMFSGKVLDVGCGDGFFASVLLAGLKTEKTTVTGIDVSKESLQLAKKKRIYTSQISYSGEQLPFKNETFDQIITNCVLEHVQNLPITLQEMHRVLKKGGILYASVMTNMWEEYLFGSKIFGLHYTRWMREKQVHHNLLSTNKWQKEFEKAGFHIEKTVGYIDKRMGNWLDILHYVSFPSLISYKVNSKWVWVPALQNNSFMVNCLAGIIPKQVSIEEAGALFIVMRKN